MKYQKNSLLLSRRRKATYIAEEHGFLSSSERAVERTEHEQSDSDNPEPVSGDINVSLRRNGTPPLFDVLPFEINNKN